MSQVKGTRKPLKGINQLNNVGYISATEIVATTITVPGLIAPDGALENVLINNAVITNSQIGVGGNNIGYFTMLQSGQPGVGYNVIFYGFNDDYFLWDPNIPALVLEAGLRVRDCSLLGDIRICGNTISSELTDEDINISPNGIGDLNISSGIYQKTTVGNFSSIVDNGTISLISGNAINIFSSSESVNIGSRKDSIISTVNGDIVFNTDTGSAVNKFFSNIIQDSPGIVKITTTTPHNYDIGDTITIRNSNSIPSVNGSYTIIDTPSKTTFTIAAGVTTSGTSGIATRTPSNNVIFNNKTGTKVIIPYQVPLQLGDNNSFVGTTGNNIITGSGTTGVVVLSSGQLFIPYDSSLRFGTIGSIWANTSGIVSVSSGNTLALNAPTNTISGTDLIINSTNVRVADPILSLGGTITSGVLYGTRDRGIEYFYNNNATSGNTVGSKLGWFGVKRDTGRFTFIPDAINNSEIISGTPGDIEANAIYSSNLSLNPGGTLDAACGSLINVNQIRGCGGSNGTLTLNGDSQVIINGRNGLVLNGTSGVFLNGNSINIQNNIPITFGTSGNTITGTTNGMILYSPFIQTSTNAVILNRGSIFSLDGSTSGIQRITTDSSGNIFIITGTTASLTLSTGNVFLPIGSSTNYGSTTSSIVGMSGGQLKISGTTINLSSGTVAIPENTPTQFGTTGSITGSQGALLINANSTSGKIVLTNSNEIDLITSTVVIPQTSKIFLDGTTGNNNISVTSTGTLSISSSTVGSVSISNSGVTISAANVLSLNTKTVKISDPIVEIGSGETRTVDRGIEYNYMTGGSRFFGFKEDTSRFVVYRSSVNNSEVISGTLGDLQVSGIYTQNLNLTTKGTLDLSCGNISRVSTISSSADCGDNLTLTTSTSSGTISVISTGDISVLGQSRIVLNQNIPVVFGTSGSSIISSSGTMTIASSSSGSLILNSKDIRLIDPIVTLGESTSTNVDRGILFVKGNTTGSIGTGFFGYKNTTGTLIYYSSATDIGTEVVGTLGNLTIGGVSSGSITASGGISLVSGNITVTNGGLTTSNDIVTNNLTVNGGTISSGTSGNLTLLSSSGNVILNPAGSAGNVILTDSKLTFGTTGDISITGTGSGTAGVLNLVSSTVAIGDTSKLSFGTSSNILNSGGSLVLQNLSGTNGGVYVSAGSLTVPEKSPIYFGSQNVNMYSEGDKLYINGYKGTIINGTDITFVGNLNVAGDFSTSTTVDFSSPYIYPLGNYNIVDISNVTQPTIGILEITTSTSNGLIVNDGITIRNTYSDPRIDSKYIVSSIINPTTFRVTTGTVLISGSTTGRIISSLVNDPQKDVGIQVNWHTGSTIGTVASKTGFFGFKRNTERWTFYNTGTNSDDVFSGTLGNIEASKAFLNNVSGFVLDGAVSAGSNAIIGSAFQIGGGSIENTPIGTNTPNTGRFTTLTSTVQTNVNNQSISGRLAFSTERFTVSSSLPTINPSSLTIVSFITVAGISFNGSGTMPDGSVDGQTKTIIISNMGANCTYTLNFSSGKLVMPNPMNINSIPTKVTFKRKGQSMNLVWDNIGSFWVPTGGNGGYVS